MEYASKQAPSSYLGVCGCGGDVSYVCVCVCDVEEHDGVSGCYLSVD